MARLKQKKKEKKGELGSGKPYDECSEVEVTRGEGEEELIRTEE